MHVLLVTRQADDGSVPAGLAAAWTAAAPRCVVEPLVVPGAPQPAPDGPPPTGGGGGGVFVPTTALGLRSVDARSVAPHLALLQDRAVRADVVVVHCPSLDAGTLHEGPVAEAASAAAHHAVPVVVLAGQDRTTRRELAAAGVAGTHVVGDPWDAALVARAARTWAPSWTRDAP